jgi:hypothetical protein
LEGEFEFPHARIIRRFVINYPYALEPDAILP